ncbi:hypothetical protein AB4212_58585 [Streptomyces sp. 2MCAF27]
MPIGGRPQAVFGFECDQWLATHISQPHRSRFRHAIQGNKLKATGADFFLVACNTAIVDKALAHAEAAVDLALSR